MFNRKENRANKDERKKGEKNLKNIMGNALLMNRDFLIKMKRNGFGESKITRTWVKINKQIKNELKNGELKAEDVEKRIDEIIMELSGNDHIITEEEYMEAETERQKEKQEKALEAVEKTHEQYKQKILKKGKVQIKVPYQSNGVASTMACAKVFGTAGVGIAALADGKVDWKYDDLILMDNGLNVKSSGTVALYEDIKEVVFGEKGFVHTVVTIVTKDGNNLIFKIDKYNAVPLKMIIEEHTSEASADDNIDALMKYGELYKQGLITKEEFDKKKQELL